MRSAEMDWLSLVPVALCKELAAFAGLGMAACLISESWLARIHLMHLA